MRKLALFLILLPVAFLPAALPAQSVLTIQPDKCVWKAGDNPAWAAPDVDDSGWHPYSIWSLDPNQPRIWVRCHVDLSALRYVPHPAIQVSLMAAYQIYVNGMPVGGAGNLRSGNFSMNTIRSFPLPEPLIKSHPAAIAARITYRSFHPGIDPTFVDRAAPIVMDLRAGDDPILDALRARAVVVDAREPLANLVCYEITGVLGFVLFGLFLYDRSRRELLLLSFICASQAAIYLAFFGSAALINVPFSADVLMFAAGAFTVNLARPWFFFALARRRMPLLFWVMVAVGGLPYLTLAIGLLLPAAESLRLDAMNFKWFVSAGVCALLVDNITPFLAFWPYSRIGRRMLPLALLSMVWGVTDLLFFSTSTAFARVIGWSNLSQWFPGASNVAAFVQACLIAALLGLLFREQRQVTKERAELAGEMASAREIQQYLIPDHVPQTPGLLVDSVYLPSNEVGGDFFQVLPDARDGSTLVVIGDVAGKGLKAGMLSALIVGAIRTAFEFTSAPGQILALLNDRLQGRGLVTCLALRIQPDGTVEIANAGHLPPYINGTEMDLLGNLPLGAVPGIAFDIIRVQLAPSDSILLLSDGVVEARSPSGELFGFDRTGAISTQAAEAIAQAAQAFGQEDDITVLTLAFAPAEVLHA